MSLNRPEDTPRDVVHIKKFSLLSKANPTTKSLKCTVPEFYVDLLQLEAGDYIEWDADVGEGKIVITIKRATEEEVKQ